MKSTDLLTAMNDLDEDLILDVKTSEPRPHTAGRKLAAVITAAVLVSTLVVTAFATTDGAGWFKNFFAGKGGSSLSSGQTAYISENTAEFSQSQTQNGYTITLESAISDGKNTFIQCKLTAPQGTVLDADSYRASTQTIFKNETGEEFYGNWETIDDDPTDNTVTMLCTFSVVWGSENSFDYTAHTWQLIIYGLQAGYYENEGTIDFNVREEDLTEGAWIFDIQFPEGSSRAVEFITEPVTTLCNVTVDTIPTENGFQCIEESVEVQITSFRLRALSAELIFQCSEKDSANGEFDDIYVVMQDGSRVLMNDRYGSPNLLGFDFDAPIVLDEVDHILLPDGTKLMMPAQ